MISKWDQFFKFIGKFRYLGMVDLPQEFFIENCPINMEYLDINAGETTSGEYMFFMFNEN